MRPAHFPFIQVCIVAVLTLAVAMSVPATLAPASSPRAFQLRDVVPADGARVPPRPVRISATIEGERDLQRVSLRVNDREVQPTVDQRDPRRWLVSYLLPLGPGEPPTGDEQKVALTARDRHGRERLQAWSFRIDPKASTPIFSAFQPPDGGYAPADGARIAATVKSDAPLTSVNLEINGTPYATTMEPAGAAGTTGAARVSLTPGNYRALVTAVDSEGDRSVGEWRFVVPDPREMLAFEATGKVISGGFRNFWQENGGLPIFGMPITDEMREGNLTVQYFERARFEYHPGQDGVTSEVKLGLLGTELRKPDPPSRQPAGDVLHFQETGHSLAGPFRRFWEENGGVAIFGLPITAEVRQGNITVQYFERARLELHSGSGGATVLLGHLGREVYERRYGTGGASRSSP